MIAQIFGGQQPKEIVKVGGAYAVAAAVGALAHVLHQKQAGGPRVHFSAPKGDMDGVLPFDVKAAWRGRSKREKRALPPKAQTVLKAADQSLSNNLQIPVSDWPAPPSGTSAQVSLYDASQAKPARLWKDAEVTSNDSTLFVDWTAADRRAHLRGDGVTSSVFFDGYKAANRTASLDSDAAPKVKSGFVAFEASDDVVIDLGMSKTVVLGARDGILNVRRFEDSGGRAGFAATARSSTDEPAADESTTSETPPSDGSDSATPVSSNAHRSTEAATPNPQPWPEILKALLALDPEESKPLYFGILAALTRAIVLVSGPPGAGKSTLVEHVARLLGFDDRWRKVPVMAHWTSDENLPDLSDQGMILLDEFNLARPERYAWELLSRARLPRDDDAGLWIFGTLNIDQASRPPSPKVLDRAFLLELDAPISPVPRSMPVVPKLLSAQALWQQTPVVSEQRDVAMSVIEKIQRCVRKYHLRQNLLPSYRALSDISRFLDWHATLSKLSSEQGHSNVAQLPTDDEVLDRVICGRLLTPISGAAEQVRPLLKELEAEIDERRHPLSHRRLQLAQAQLALGFCSPWP